MDLVHATAGIDASGRCIVRGERLARVKFVALPLETTPGNAFREAPRLGECRFSRFPGVRAIRQSVLRVIGRLVAARP